jgi:hypothetical protein
MPHDARLRNVSQLYSMIESSMLAALRHNNLLGRWRKGVALAKLLDQARELIRKEHHAISIGKACGAVMKRFIILDHKHHPEDTGERKILQHLYCLASDLKLTPHRETGA